MVKRPGSAQHRATGDTRCRDHSARTSGERGRTVAGVMGRLAPGTAPIAMLVVGTQSYGSLPIGARLAAAVSVSTAVLAPSRAGD